MKTDLISTRIELNNPVTLKAMQDVEDGKLNQANSTESLFDELGISLKDT